MAKLIYSMLTSLDGHTEDAHGHFGWGAPQDEEVHSYVNQLASSHDASLSLPSVKDAITRGRPLIAGFGERIVTTPVGGHAP